VTAKPIVAATDGSAESLQAVEWAARAAALRGAPLRIVSATGLLPRMMDRWSDPDLDTVASIIARDRDRALAAAAHRAIEVAPRLLVDTDRLAGPPAQAITESGSGAALLVVGSRGIGAFTAMVLGSVSRYAATHATCPVVVVRDDTTAAHRQVGIGLGDLDHCADSLTFAFEEAALRQASLTVLHAWHAPQSDISRAGQSFTGADGHEAQVQARRQLAELLEGWRQKYPDVPVSLDIVHGHPGRALVGLSARADLVVVGRHSDHQGPGSARHAVLNHAHGPVAIVPSA
jgi:nucleotide-binding universal stress UspA family protein